MILQKIIENKKKELALINDFGRLKPSERNFKACLKGKNNIIAEIKKKSPSEGSLFGGDVKDIAGIYDKYANAISIVVDKKFFGGDKKDIQKIKEVTSLPILCKDFIIDEKQILELRHYGADAVLLIAPILSKEQINRFVDAAREYNMDCLVEVHTEEELKKVLETKAELIGINNRDLSTFKVNLEITKKLKKLIPKDKLIVSESGFNNINGINSADVNAVLIGTSLLKSKDISKKLSSLRKPKVKICGITNIEDAYNAVKYGADLLGFNFYEKSPRYIKPENAKKIIEKLANNVAIVGVFVNEKIEKVKEIAKIGLDVLQFHGDESPEYCSSFSLPVIKAFHIGKEIPDISKYKVFACIFDTFDENAYGGTGRAFNFDIIKNVNRKVFISGGLNNENVKEALNFDPYCIDVCSGVEMSEMRSISEHAQKPQGVFDKKKGIKDKEKMKEFVRMVKE